VVRFYGDKAKADAVYAYVNLKVVLSLWKLWLTLVLLAVATL
jgi:hypothetical protein